MKKILLVATMALVFAFGYQAKAQMSYGGEPYSFKHNDISLSVPTVDIEAVPAQALLEEDAARGEKGHALRIGVTKDVYYSMENSGRTDIMADGSRVWRLAFHMKDATFTSMSFSTFEIPEGAELYIYTPDREYVIGKFTYLNQMEDGAFYPQELPGEDVVIEYFEPAKVAGLGKLVINQIEQGYYDFFHIYEKNIEGAIGTAEGTCHPNAICYDATWHDQIQSIVCYTQSSGGYVYMCSGAMINNTSHDKTQYMLSANHCFESSTTTSWKFYFNYQATTCAGNNGSILKTATGCTVKARDDYNSSDFMLVQITGTINPAFNVYLAGWDNTTTLPSNATSCGAIHHPGGDIKKFSVPQNIANGQLSGYAKYWLANWAYATGTTEGGSSGSPLFNKNKLIVGQLYAGTSSCVAVSGDNSHAGPSGYDLYGKLSNSWTNNNNSSNAKKLKPWLDPNNSGATTLQGEYLNGGSSIASSEINLLNVYPNPSTGIVTVSGDFAGVNGICNVYDMTGHLVISKNIELAPEFTLNFSNLSVGMYTMEVNDSATSFRTKIIITK